MVSNQWIDSPIKDYWWRKVSLVPDLFINMSVKKRRFDYVSNNISSASFKIGTQVSACNLFMHCGHEEPPFPDVNIFKLCIKTNSILCEKLLGHFLLLVYI